MAATEPVKAALARAYTAPGPPVRPVRRRSPRKRSAPAVARNRAATQSSSQTLPAAVAPPPAWARDLLRDDADVPRPVQAIPNERLRHGDVVRSAVRSIATSPLSEDVVADDRIPPALVDLLHDQTVFTSPTDRCLIIAAVRTLIPNRDTRDALLSAKVLPALVTVARESETVVGSPGRAEPRPKVWCDAVSCMSELFSCSNAACADAIESGSLPILAVAAAPGEDMHVRARAARGLAAVGLWSGPRMAVRIVETPGVVKAMSAILTETDDLVSSQVKTATMDALVAMSFHRKARRILKDEGCDSTITAAAKQASMSGDYDFAALGTIAAGHVNGHSVDEFGFLVLVGDGELPPSPRSGSPSQGGELAGSPVTGSDKSRSSPVRQARLTNDSDDDPEGQNGLTYEESGNSALMAFSSVTRKAAAVRSDVNPKIRKSESQVNRDTEHEQYWRDVIEKQPQLLDRETGKVRRVAGYRSLATVPLPSVLRSTLWPMLLGVPDVRNAQPGLYEALCKSVDEEALDDDSEHTIEADVTRTMPQHALFWAGGPQVGVKTLRNILRAYARHRPDVGYCQGMSSVAAVFMMNAYNEEDAFLMFSQFMEHYQYKKVFAEGFPKMRQWLDELRPLIYHYMPHLWTHLERENVPLELYADKWLITALSHNFPHRYLLRVWDLMFLGGSPKIILKSCLAVLKTAEKKCLTMHFEGIMHLLQRDFAKPEMGLLDVLNPEPFLELARSFRFEENPRKPPVKAEQRPGSSAQRPAQANAQQAMQGTQPAVPHPPEQRRRRDICNCFGKSRTVD